MKNPAINLLEDEIRKIEAVTVELFRCGALERAENRTNEVNQLKDILQLLKMREEH